MVRRSTTETVSMKGRMKKRPGPTTPSFTLPSRKMMARSYSCTVFRQKMKEKGKPMTTRRMEKNLRIPSKMVVLLLPSSAIDLVIMSGATHRLSRFDKNSTLVCSRKICYNIGFLAFSCILDKFYEE